MEGKMSTAKQLVQTDTKGFKPSVDRSNSWDNKKFDNDQLYEQLSDVINADLKWRPWYCKQFYRLGRSRTLQLAAIAKADAKVDPKRYFSKLLKQHA